MCVCVSLQLMHSQGTDYQISDMAIDPAVEVLASTATHYDSGINCLSLHTLNTNYGFLAFQAQLQTRHSAAPTNTHQRVRRIGALLPLL